MKTAVASGAVVTALLIGWAAPGVPAGSAPGERAIGAWRVGASAVMAQTKAPTAAPAAAAGRHTVEGRVTKVDAKRGWIDVKTPEGSMKLHFPPTALEGVKTGDSVSVELAMTTAPGADRTQKLK